jgi:hypothetical protein
MDPNYGAWEIWCKNYVPRLVRTLTSPYRTEKQQRSDFLHALSLYQSEFQRCIMAKRSGSNGDAPTVSVDFWVNTRLDDDDKATIRDSAPTLSTLLADFGTLVYSGYRLSVVPDKFSDAVQASLVCVDPAATNAGCGVSARHPDVETALMYLMFKVTRMGDTPWRDFAPPPSEDKWG